MVKHCKEVLHLDSVSIVSNGSLLKEDWFKNFGQYVDILAISCDSFDEQVNKEIGRAPKLGRSKSSHVEVRLLFSLQIRSNRTCFTLIYCCTPTQLIRIRTVQLQIFLYHSRPCVNELIFRSSFPRTLGELPPFVKSTGLNLKLIPWSTASTLMRI